jgi:hypothetical protein
LILILLLNKQTDLKPVADLIDGLPLALDQAGSLLRYYPIDSYVKTWETNWNELAKDMEKGKNLKLEQYRGIYTTWNTSLEYVKKEAEDGGNAAKLLQFSSYLDHRRIDYALLRSPETTKSEEFATKQLPSWFQAVVKTEAALRRSVGILQNYSLIRLVKA